MLNRLLDRRARAAQAQPRSGAKRAFTLVELLIVLLLIAILMAMVIPQFFGAKQKAGDRVAQQTLTEAVQTAKVFATDDDNFTTATTANLTTAEPNINWIASTGSASVTNNKRDVATEVTTPAGKSTDSEMVLVAQGENQGCWYVKLYTNGTADAYGYFQGSSDSSCTTANAIAATNEGGTFPDRNAAVSAP